MHNLKFTGWVAGLMVLAGLASGLRADTPETVTIPLQNILLPGGTYRLGIAASIGGGNQATYLLDTGSFGFFSAYKTGASWWGNFTDTGKSGNVSYTGGIAYNFDTVTANVTLGGNSLATATDVRLGQIVSVTLNGTADAAFNTALMNGTAPEAGTFYGTLGAGLGRVDDGAGGLFSIIAQMPGNLASGFIIHTGGPGGKATLTIGLTPALRQEFSMQVPMQGQNTTVTFPGSGYPTYDLRLVSGHLKVDNSGARYTGKLDIIFDTGDPSAVIFDKDNLKVPKSDITNGLLTAGDRMTLAANGTVPANDWQWSVTAGTLTGQDRVVVSTTVPAGGPVINTGITPFFTQDIMFDIQNGVVGFNPITPAEYSQLVADATPGTTTAAKLKVSGIARGTDSVVGVHYSLNGGPYTRAIGTLNWHFTVKLTSGMNTIKVRAVNGKGMISKVETIVVVKS
jgi:hypothetical protein